MTRNPDGEPGIPMSDGEIEAAVAVANVPALLMVVHQFTGDRAWLRPPFRPTRGKGIEDHDSGGLGVEVQDRVRHAAREVIARLLRGAAPALDMSDPARMVEAMGVYMGEEISAEYGPMLATEFARRCGSATDDVQPVPPPAGTKVLVIGAGVGGVAAARQLSQLGVEFTLVEKAAAPGGVWWQNSYPGAGVDTPSHLYSLSFARNDWHMHFAMRDEIQSYLAKAAHDLIRDGCDFRFGHEVLTARHDADAGHWVVRLRLPDGQTQTVTADIVLSSVGGLNVPRLPALPGMGSFAGETFHSAQWPAGARLAGKRVIVVGTGASAMQIVPAIAGEVEQLTIVQRSPQWVAPFPKFRLEIPEALRLLLASCPLYYAWYWLRLFWQFGDNVIASLYKDPAWPHPERSVNSRNDGHRRFFTHYVKDQLGNRTDLLPKVLPGYPPFGKRILLDNGWFQTLCRPNVRLVNDTVREVRPEGLVVGTGELLSADVVVWATGFDASRFVATLDVRNHSGLSLHEFWHDDDPTAYLGVSVPGFPNFFMLGGPNSFPGSGSIMFWLELQTRYVGRLLVEMFRKGVSSACVRSDVHDRYNQMIDSRHEHMVWTHPGMRTYYRNAHGRVVFVSPFRNVEFWEMLREVDLTAYDTTTDGRHAPG